jgi:hypothetical protein
MEATSTSSYGNMNTNSNINLNSSRAEDVWNALKPPLYRAWTEITSLTSADNGSLSSTVLRLLFTISSYILMFTHVSGSMLWSMAYLLDHRWYVLAVTSSVALLAVSSVLLTSYEWMWRWQEWLVVPRRPVVTVVDDDDDDSIQAWAKTLGRSLMILLIWALYCVVNTKLDFWIWSQYLVAHPDHNLEIRLVNWLQAGPVLFGAAYAMYYLYPPFYTWHARQPRSLASSDEPDSDPDLSMQTQSLL